MNHPAVRDIVAKYNLKVVCICAVIALFVGVFIGLATASSQRTTHTALPVATSLPVKAQVVTKTVQIRTVPKSCLTALDNADDGFEYASDITSEFHDAIEAIQSGDIHAIEVASKNIRSINGDLNELSPEYNTNKATCRESAK